MNVGEAGCEGIPEIKPRPELHRPSPAPSAVKVIAIVGVDVVAAAVMWRLRRRKWW